jgi:hypothetical protein
MSLSIAQAVKIESFSVSCKANIKSIGFDYIHTITPLPNKKEVVVSDNEEYIEIWNWHTNTCEKSLDIKGKCIKQYCGQFFEILK